MPITSSVLPEAIEAYGEAEQQRMRAAGVAPSGMASPAADEGSAQKRVYKFSFLQVLLFISGLAIIAAAIRAYGFFGLIEGTTPTPASDSGVQGITAIPPGDLLAPLAAISLAVERLIETGFSWYERATRKTATVLKEFQTTGEWVGQELNNAIQAVQHAASKLGTDVQIEDMEKFNLAKQRLADAEELIHGWTKAPEYVAFKRASSIMIGIVTGLVVAIGGDLRLLNALEIDAPIVLDMIITGFAIGSGPGPMHTIVGVLEGAKNSLMGLATSLNNNPVKSEVEKLQADVARMNAVLPYGLPQQAPIQYIAQGTVPPTLPPGAVWAPPTTSPPGPGEDGAWG